MLIVVGDLHGNFKVFLERIKQYDLRDATIIQVGDFGMGFGTLKKDKATLKYLNRTLSSRNVQLKVLRGNHDDPSRFDGSIQVGNVQLLPDYSIVEIDQFKVLCVGGAISIDRKPRFDMSWKGRTEGKDYWSKEPFVLRTDLLQDLKDINVVITHSSPDFCEPRSKEGMMAWVKSDPSLLEECAKERNDLSKMYDILKANGCPYRQHFFGHFHFSKHEYINDTLFKLLDIDEFHDVRL